MHDVARREVLAGVLVEGLVELPDELLEDRAHREVVDRLGVEVDAPEALHHREEEPHLVELGRMTSWYFPRLKLSRIRSATLQRKLTISLWFIGALPSPAAFLQRQGRGAVHRGAPVSRRPIWRRSLTVRLPRFNSNSTWSGAP
jgi:hypothetical protein